MVLPRLPATAPAPSAAPVAALSALNPCITFRFAANSAMLAISFTPLPTSQNAASVSNPAITLSMFSSLLSHSSAAARSLIALPISFTIPLSLSCSFFPAPSSFPAAFSSACLIRSKNSSMSFSSCARSSSLPVSRNLIRSSRIRCAFPVRSSASLPKCSASKLSRNARHVVLIRSTCSASVLMSWICSFVMPIPPFSASNFCRFAWIVCQSFSRSRIFVARFSPNTSPAAASFSS